MKRAYIINNFWGMGDGVWTIPYIKQLSKEYDEIYLYSSWPQLYWAFPKVKVLHPDYSEDAPYKKWDYFQESINAQPDDIWNRPSQALLDECDKIEFLTNEGCSYIGKVHPMHLDEVDLYIPLKPEWLTEIENWLNQLPKPWVMLHIPIVNNENMTKETWVNRFTYGNTFELIYENFKDKVSFFDVTRWPNRNTTCFIANVNIPRKYSLADQVHLLWASFYLTDLAVGTDNHFIPLSLAYKKLSLVLLGAVPYEVLFDPRLDISNHVILQSARIDGYVPGYFPGNLNEDEVLNGFNKLLKRWENARVL